MVPLQATSSKSWTTAARRLSVLGFGRRSRHISPQKTLPRRLGRRSHDDRLGRLLEQRRLSRVEVLARAAEDLLHEQVRVPFQLGYTLATGFERAANSPINDFNSGTLSGIADRGRFSVRLAIEVL